MPVKSFEPIDPTSDVTTTRTFLHEVVPISGSIISGTYGVFTAENNVKNYTHGMFQSVYDYPVLSSSANHIFDITMGYDESSALSHSTSPQNSKKINELRKKWIIDTVVIDPGHGGKDPGAIGVNKIKEKDIALDISKQLGKMIERNLGLKVCLLYTSDAADE